MTDVDDFDDVALRTALREVLPEQPREDDVDAAWRALVRTVRDERRRRRNRLLGVAAAVVIVVAALGRSTVVSSGGALARFFSDAVEDGVGPAVRERVDDALRATSVTHGPIDESNEFWVEVRDAHDQLNDAVGWERWRPEKLDGAADRLRAVAPLDTELGAKALEAADLIDAATRTHDRDDAVQAHRVVNDIETLLQRRR